MRAPMRTRSPGEPPRSRMPMENNPQVIFKRLFGDGSNTAQRQERRTRSPQHSRFRHRLRRFAAKGAASDRPGHAWATISKTSAKSSGAFRKRISRPRRASKSRRRPSASPRRSTNTSRFMFDLQVLAFRAEITRVATMMYARDTSGAVYPQQRRARRLPRGIAPLQRPRQHGQVRADQPLSRAMLAYFLEKLQVHAGRRRQPARSFDGPLRQQHEQRQPARSRSAAGDPGRRSSGQLEGGRHIKTAPHTPASNLLLSMLNKLGVPEKSHGDSTGLLEI